MFTLGDTLLFATEKCTYRLQVADQIDPDRKNPSLPHNVQQKIFDHGTGSELLCNTLLLAKSKWKLAERLGGRVVNANGHRQMIDDPA